MPQKGVLRSAKRVARAWRSRRPAKASAVALQLVCLQSKRHGQEPLECLDWSASWCSNDAR